MDALQQDDRPAFETATPAERWLHLLESELRHRVGWADEAVSPFARHVRTRQANADLPHAT